MFTHVIVLGVHLGMCSLVVVYDYACADEVVVICFQGLRMFVFKEKVTT